MIFLRPESNNGDNKPVPSPGVPPPMLSAGSTNKMGPGPRGSVSMRFKTISRAASLG